MIKRVWARKGSRPRVRVTGSHQKTAVYGSLADDGTSLFRQYPRCNGAYFIAYLKELLNRYDRFILFIDKAPWHRSKKTAQFLEAHADRIRVRWFPTGFPEANAVEECWRQGRYADTLGTAWHESFGAFRSAVSRYYRTKRFRLDLEKYLCP